MQYSEKDIARFWSKVDKERSQTFYNGTRCWEWIAGRFPKGYGAFRMGERIFGSHCISYEMSQGEIPLGLFILHHCDNRLCVNPKHLFVGTPKDNTDDMISKGRQAILSGDRNGSHKLTAEQIESIRLHYGWFGKGGKTTKELAKEFGVSQSHVSAIVKFVYRKDG